MEEVYFYIKISDRNAPAVKEMENPSYAKFNTEYDQNQRAGPSDNYNSNPYNYSTRKPAQNNYLDNYEQHKSYENSPERDGLSNERSKIIMLPS